MKRCPLGHFWLNWLNSGSKRIEAHRIVLSSASDYFSAMFNNNFGESFQNEIELQEVEPDALEELVAYCYTGRVNLEEETVEMLMATACLLQLPEVVDACSSFLIRQLHPSNCLGIRLFADSQSCVRLLTVAQHYTADHFIDVIGSQEFVLLPADEVAKLLANEDLNVPNEELMFQALMLWLRHDLPDRQKELPRLLSLVKLPLLSPQFIADHIESNPIFREERLCQELIVEALKYHLLPERRSALQSPRTRPRKSTVSIMKPVGTDYHSNFYDFFLSRWQVGSLYIVGGMDASTKGPTTVDKFDLRTNAWTLASSMTGRRLQFGVAVIDSKIYVVGGRDGLKTLSTVLLQYLSERALLITSSGVAGWMLGPRYQNLELHAPYGNPPTRPRSDDSGRTIVCCWWSWWLVLSKQCRTLGPADSPMDFCRSHEQSALHCRRCCLTREVSR